MGMVELNAVRRGFELFERGRRDVIFENLPETFELRDTVILEGFEATGRDAMPRNLESVGEAFADVSWKPMEYRDLGASVAVRVTRGHRPRERCAGHPRGRPALELPGRAGRAVGDLPLDGRGAGGEKEMS